LLADCHGGPVALKILQKEQKERDGQSQIRPGGATWGEKTSLERDRGRFKCLAEAENFLEKFSGGSCSISPPLSGRGGRGKEQESEKRSLIRSSSTYGRSGGSAKRREHLFFKETI